ncbi:glucosidase 2 subunit beta [Condylostylus longicornis]|uniref:glucosidase 2 subunit beta n=1 Tax=Condylostylus longicornis TaxID=2530218 RepID=UPI00244DB6D7|nr:glucosidase 2 subunit beta [Condylostylus longicornis]
MVKFSTFSLIIILLCGLVKSAGPNRPRGVSISRAPLYPEGDTFSCLDGKKTIKFSQVNDDFCDCEDSSDEPGTSACSNGLFYCTNAGHRSKYIPSSRVNDGICDCCDGSDEYDSEVNCESNCLELGRAERQRERSRQELLKRGAQIKADLILKGKTLKTEKSNLLLELQQRKNEAEAIRNEKESMKKEAESLENEALEIYKELQEVEKREKQEKEALENKREAEETFEKFDSNKDSFIEVIEIQTRIAFDQNRDGVVAVEEAKYFLDEHDKVDREKFITTCWSRIKPYLMLDSGFFKPPKENDNAEVSEQNEIKTQSKEGANIVNTQTDDEDVNEFNDEKEEAELLNEEDEYNEDEPEEIEEENEGEVEETKPEPEYDPETQKLIDNANAARTEFHDAEHNVRKIDNEIKDIQESLNKDYGVNYEFATLNGECFDFEDREYVYKLCPFDKTSQQPKSGGSETRLGTWTNWDGKENKYSHMLYSNGASCWNGPQRSAIVELECGLENRITSVTEPNRCEYKFNFETPAACSFQEELSEENMEELHDEL